MVDLAAWVAVVDDDEMVRRAVSRLLRAYGIEARTFESAQDYLSSVPSSAPACLILDMHLHDVMTGLELSEHLRARNAAPPIIFVTAQDEAELSRAADGSDVVLLRKPFNPNVLLELVVERVKLNSTNAVQ